MVPKEPLVTLSPVRPTPLSCHQMKNTDILEESLQQVSETFAKMH